MSRGDLAAKAGVDPKTLYNLEVSGRWPIAVTRSKIEAALGWPSGEMERIASAPEAPPQPPLIAPDVLAVIRRHYGPAEQRRAIEVLESIELERREGAPPAAAPAAAPERERDAG